MKVISLPNHLENHQKETTQNQNKYLEKERENFVKGFIGVNKTGKTTIEKQVALDWINGKDDDYSIIGFDPRGQIQDILDRQIYITDSDADIIAKIDDTRNALMILDDYKILHDEDKARSWVKYLMQQKDGYNIDIIYSCHNPMLVINVFTYFTTHYYIFYTNTLDGSWRSKIPNYSLCLAGSNYINKYVRKHGRGTYPNFPFMYIDTENEKLTGINMNLEL